MSDDSPEAPEYHENDVCTWTADPQEKRRAFVANLLADSDIDGDIQLENMHRLCEWLRTGTRPAPKLKAVK
jgi:hypothetical protein